MPQTLQPLFSRAQTATGISLATRIILINTAAMLLMVSGLIYFGGYLDRLVGNEVGLQLRQARLVASRLAADAYLSQSFDLDKTRGIVTRQSMDLEVQTRVIAADGHVVFELVPPLPPPPTPTPEDTSAITRLSNLVDWLAMVVPYGSDLPLYNEQTAKQAQQTDFDMAQQGQPHWSLWKNPRKSIVITAAAPIMHNDQVVGVVHIVSDSQTVANTMRSLRVELLQTFGLMLGISTLISIYMAQTIAAPLRRLAQAAQRAQAIAGGAPQIPQYSQRGDEIGELSAALQGMTRTLWERLGAIEHFAADVAHELKNPLTSMKSALETLQRVQEPAQRDKLLAIVAEDITRMQRLITDISGASRLEAELTRTPPELFDLSAVLSNLVGNCLKSGARLQFHVRETGLMVLGSPSRLIQVAENLIANARSFSPPDAPVILRLSGQAHQVLFLVEDSGPGIAPGKEEKIFDRFYSERRGDAISGNHSGLGLSICRQIIEGHGGRIRAENRLDDKGNICGARFIVTLPRQDD